MSRDESRKFQEARAPESDRVSRQDHYGSRVFPNKKAAKKRAWRIWKEGTLKKREKMKKKGDAGFNLLRSRQPRMIQEGVQEFSGN